MKILASPIGIKAIRDVYLDDDFIAQRETRRAKRQGLDQKERIILYCGQLDIRWN
jgi:hypothetical protein